MVVNRSIDKTAGTSSGGKSTPDFPGLVCSKIKSSLRVTCGLAVRMRFSIFLFCPNDCIMTGVEAQRDLEAGPRPAPTTVLSPFDSWARSAKRACTSVMRSSEALLTVSVTQTSK